MHAEFPAGDSAEIIVRFNIKKAGRCIYNHYSKTKKI